MSSKILAFGLATAMAILAKAQEVKGDTDVVICLRNPKYFYGNKGDHEAGVIAAVVPDAAFGVRVAELYPNIDIYTPDATEKSLPLQGMGAFLGSGIEAGTSTLPEADEAKGNGKEAQDDVPLNPADVVVAAPEVAVAAPGGVDPFTLDKKPLVEWLAERGIKAPSGANKAELQALIPAS